MEALGCLAPDERGVVGRVLAQLAGGTAALRVFAQRMQNNEYKYDSLLGSGRSHSAITAAVSTPVAC